MGRVQAFVIFAALLGAAVALPTPQKNAQEAPQTFDVKAVLSGIKVANWNVDSKVNPEELGAYFQGDIISEDLKNGLLDETKRWPGGEVPYEIVGDFAPEELQLINEAIDAYHANTCLKLRPKTSSDEDYISIKNDESGCWSSVGRVGGKQDINLQSPGCVTRVGTAIHEILHAVGFYHEQSRWERDDYVTIMWDNIMVGLEHNFDKYDSDTVSGFGVEYDYGSVMHYSAGAFSSNGEATIVPLDSNAVIGQREGFSPSDIAKVKAMYNCP